MKIKALLAGMILATVPFIAAAQSDGSETEFATIDETIEALYASISGEKGEARDWETFRRLFTDGARLIPTGTDSDGGSVIHHITPEQYIEQSGPYLVENGFIEEEIHRVTDRFGPIAQVFSTYTSRNSAEGEIFARGINSIQLFNDGTRWWVVTIYWSGEGENTPIPAEYLEEN